jgi:hypothetical protein
LDGYLHRSDGPAIDYVDGEKKWYVYGKRHRTDGPAHIKSGVHRWFLKNEKVVKPTIVNKAVQDTLTSIILSRAVNPFCEINVAKYAL